MCLKSQTGPKRRRLLITALAACILSFGSSSVFAELISVSLYFPHKTELVLGVEERSIEQASSVPEFAGALMAELMKGPSSDLEPVMPEGDNLRQVYVDSSGTAYVDLNGASLKALAGGAARERLIIWAIVNTLCLNVDEIKAVKFLIDGREAAVFSGHIDISRSLFPDEGLVIENDDN